MSERFPAQWMCTLDERIIEYVASESLASPRLMEKEIGFNASRQRIYERCRMLSAAGLIAPMCSSANQFEITARGEKYLDGKLDAEHLPRPSPRVV